MVQEAELPLRAHGEGLRRRGHARAGRVQEGLRAPHGAGRGGQEGLRVLEEEQTQRHEGEDFVLEGNPRSGTNVLSSSGRA